MTPREALVRETREWLDKSNSDLRACGVLIASDLPAEALFHAQQCAEKAMKALLTWHKVLFRKTHELDVLKMLCLPLLATLPDELEDIDQLTKYAWRFRYPGAPYVPDREEAEHAMLVASGLLHAITTLLAVHFTAREKENSQA
jgi:HEPN domain-containing protein